MTATLVMVFRADLSLRGTPVTKQSRTQSGGLLAMTYRSIIGRGRGAACEFFFRGRRIRAGGVRRVAPRPHFYFRAKCEEWVSGTNTFHQPTSREITMLHRL